MIPELHNKHAIPTTIFKKLIGFCSEIMCDTCKIQYLIPDCF